MMKNYLKKFKKDFNDSFENNLDFNQIKQEITYNLRDSRSNFFYRFRYASVLLLIVILGGVFMIVATNKIRYRENEDSEDLSNVESVTEWADYVFIARVEQKLYTEQYDGNGYDLPYTYYSLSDVTYLKGRKEGYERLLFYGGYDFLRNLVIFRNNDIIPEEGEYYLFFVKKIAPSEEDSRAEPGSFYLMYNEQKIQLRGFTPEKDWHFQNSHITNIITPYIEEIEE